MIRGYFEDNKVGTRVVSRARTVTEADVVAFAALSGDWHPLHTDAEFAKHGPFGERIAHGMLVVSIATGLVRLDPETVLAFYGLDRLRFVRPTHIGDTLHVVSEVIEAVPRDDASGLIVNEARVENARGDLVATAIFRMLVRRHPSAQPPNILSDELDLASEP